MYGEITSPWGTPCESIIFSDMWPPIRICASLFVKKSLIQVMMSGPKPRTSEPMHDAIAKIQTAVSGDFVKLP